jgi:flavin prenyltransferase
MDALVKEKIPRIIVGISGASGIEYGICILKTLRELKIETHLVVSKAAQQVRHHESDYSAKDLNELAGFVYAFEDIACALSSGSFVTLGMIVAPCSMRTLAEIASGVTSNALSRAAEVVLKERRRLVLMARETPLTAQHLRNMLTVTEMGGIIAPPVPAFYNRPETITDIVNHSVGRVLDLFDINLSTLKRWD